jgi:hypothetical protein
MTHYPKTNCMNKFVILTSLLLIAARGNIHAQNNNITLVGKVLDDKTGVALPGATVHIKERRMKSSPTRTGNSAS